MEGVDARRRAAPDLRDGGGPALTMRPGPLLVRALRLGGARAARGAAVASLFWLPLRRALVLLARRARRGGARARAASGSALEATAAAARCSRWASRTRCALARAHRRPRPTCGCALRQAWPRARSRRASSERAGLRAAGRDRCAFELPVRPVRARPRAAGAAARSRARSGASSSGSCAPAVASELARAARPARRGPRCTRSSTSFVAARPRQPLLGAARQGPRVRPAARVRARRRAAATSPGRPRRGAAS